MQDTSSGEATEPRTEEAAEEPANGPAKGRIAPEGSTFDKNLRQSRRKGHRLRHLLLRPAVRVLGWIVPPLLRWYCGFVWWTSKIEGTIDQLATHKKRYGRVICLTWHHHVVTVGYVFQSVRPHTLASTKYFGRIITRILEPFGFVVFRGASGTRRASSILRSMIEHMRATPSVLFGITCDGPRGPRHEMKRGGALIAKSCRAPIILADVTYSRRLELPTWDRTVVPLPFSRVRIDTLGPYWIKPDASRTEVEEFRTHLELELRELFDRSREVVDGRAPSTIPKRMPEGFVRRWKDDVWGLARTEYDLKPDAPPPWAPGEAEGPEILRA